MCGNNWQLLGLCALVLGAAIVIVALFPVGFWMILIAAALILLGIGLLRKR